jgi:hypothetical protein
VIEQRCESERLLGSESILRKYVPEESEQLRSRRIGLYRALVERLCPGECGPEDIVRQFFESGRIEIERTHLASILSDVPSTTECGREFRRCDSSVGERTLALDEHALCASRAQLAEHAGELEEAAALYAEAAGRWLESGNVPERAYALLGQGRCLRALGRPGAEEPLLEARELLASMGYVPALGEVDGLLGSAETAARKRQLGG